MVISAEPACPRCDDALPAGAFFGPCATCRAQLAAGADASFADRLARVGAALDEGWHWDVGEARWIHPRDAGDAL